VIDVRTASRSVAPVAPDARVIGRVHLERLPELDGADIAAVAEAFRDLPGLAVLDCGRPHAGAGWSVLTADPLAVIARPSDDSDPFQDARAMLRRLPATPVGARRGEPLPPFLGGFVGFVAYEVGALLEPRVAPPDADQRLPLLRFGLHDWAIAWHVRTGEAWLGGRAADGDTAALARRLDDVRDRVAEWAFGRRPAPASGPDPRPFAMRSNLSRATYVERVEAIRDAIARGELYQANLTRRLETPFNGDPWPLWPRLRGGNPAPFGAYLDLGCTDDGPRAILSASPEAFLAVDPDGRVTTDPIKGTRARGATRDEDRRLACELLGSAKDRAENVMIVDVLRNDLGRVAVPGSVRVPRLCRLERTGAVQHLVSRVEAQVREGVGPFDLIAASFPGGSITGAPKIRAMELLTDLEPVARGPYTGTLGWIGPDGAMRTSILIRTFVADGRRLTLHVGGGITWRSDPAAEWDETVAKARGPLRAIGAYEVDGAPA
jgi:para-aminobenzoate synthetase component 1